MTIALTVIWANALFLGALCIFCGVLSAVLVVAIDKYREDRRLSNELAEYDKEFDQ